MHAQICKSISEEGSRYYSNYDIEKQNGQLAATSPQNFLRLIILYSVWLAYSVSDQHLMVCVIHGKLKLHQ